MSPRPKITGSTERELQALKLNQSQSQNCGDRGEGLQVQGQPGEYSKTVSQILKKKRKEKTKPKDQINKQKTVSQCW
jgi:preprotein translocase subunit SecF